MKKETRGTYTTPVNWKIMLVVFIAWVLRKNVTFTSTLIVKK